MFGTLEIAVDTLSRERDTQGHDVWMDLGCEEHDVRVKALDEWQAGWLASITSFELELVWSPHWEGWYGIADESDFSYRPSVEQLNRWGWFGYDDEDPGDISVDDLGRLWVPTYDGRDGICGSHTVGRIPAAQRYAMNLSSWQYRRDLAEHRRTEPCPYCTIPWADCDCPF